MGEVSKVNTDIAVRNRNYHTATGNRMPYGIRQCYLIPSNGDSLAFTLAEAGTRFSIPAKKPKGFKKRPLASKYRRVIYPKKGTEDTNTSVIFLGRNIHLISNKCRSNVYVTYVYERL